MGAEFGCRTNSRFLDAGYDTEANPIHDKYGMDYPGGNPNTPYNTPASFASDFGLGTIIPSQMVKDSVVPEHHGHPAIKAVGAGALAGGAAVALKVGMALSGGIGLAAAGITYLITKPAKK